MLKGNSIDTVCVCACALVSVPFNEQCVSVNCAHALSCCFLELRVLTNFSYTLNMICCYLRANQMPIPYHAKPYKLEMIALSHIEPIKMPLLLYSINTLRILYFNKNKKPKKRVLINEEYRKCFVSVFVLIPRSGLNRRKTTQQKHDGIARAQTNYNTICQTNVICKWASHDMWLDILNMFTRINRLINLQIGRVHFFCFDLRRYGALAIIFLLFFLFSCNTLIKKL